MNRRDKVIRDNAFREVNRYEPPKVAGVRKKRGEKAAERMKAGIALDLARKRGANV